MAAITVELELAGGTWGGGIFASHRGIAIKNTDDLDDALHQIKSAVETLTAPPAKTAKPVEEIPPAPPPPARADDGQPTPRKPRGQRRTTPEPFFPADAGGSTENVRT